MKNYLVFSMAALLVGASCNTKQEKAAEGFTGAPGEVKLITLDPGHFHAALVRRIRRLGMKSFIREMITWKKCWPRRRET